MANPVIVACVKDTWTKVAEDITIGQVWIIDSQPDYFSTYRDFGGAAPTTDSEAVRLPLPGMPIRSPIGIDVYVMAKGRAGEVRIDRGE